MAKGISKHIVSLLWCESAAEWGNLLYFSSVSFPLKEGGEHVSQSTCVKTAGEPSLCSLVRCVYRIKDKHRRLKWRCDASPGETIDSVEFNSSTS